MSRSQEWKDRRDAVLPARKDRAKNILRNAGIEVIGETKYSLIVRINCNNVEYFPFTGGYSGKGIKPGCGIKNLIAQKK